jgi:DNA-binding transcriptional regulator YiaG
MTNNWGQISPGDAQRGEQNGSAVFRPGGGSEEDSAERHVWSAVPWGISPRSEGPTRASTQSAPVDSYLRSAMLWGMDTAAAVLRDARRRAGLSQVELGRRAGVTQSVVSAYESGARQPSLPMLARLVGATGLELDIRLSEPEAAGLASGLLA